MSADLDIKRPSAAALGEMFARVRDRLAELGGAPTADDLAAILSLTIYLTWQAEVDAPDSAALALLKSRVAEALQA